MPVIVILGSDAPVESPNTVLTLQEVLTGTVGGFLEVSQVLRGTVQRAEIVMDTYLSGTVAATPASTAGVLDLVMGGGNLESFSYSAQRGQGSRMDVTVIGDARGGTAPGVTVSAGGWSASFGASGDLGEWEYERDALGSTTTLHASGGSLTPTTKLPELVAWETQQAKDARKAAEKALQVARVPVAQRPAALWDGRRMGVDELVLAALASVPHRLLVAPPFPGYEFRADGGPSYSTLDKSVDSVVSDIWGKVGITAGWEDGVLAVRKPGPVGDVTLGAPVEKERIERITLDAQTVEVTGGETADPEDSDPYSPDNPKNSPDPAERGEKPDGSDNGGDGNGNNGNGGDGNKDGSGNQGGGFVGQLSPTPQVGEISSKAIPLTWERVPFASSYAVESYEGIADQYTLWGLGAQTSATQMTIGARPNTIYSVRLVVYATAFENDQTRNIIYLPSEVVQVRTPPEFPDELPPRPVTGLEGYNRSETGFGVKWTPPSADPDTQAPPRVGAADSYTIRVRQGATQLALRTTPQSYAYFDGLPVGATLTVEVRAVNGAGESTAVTAEVQLVNLPPAPVGEVTLTATQNTVTATWEPISGGEDYVVQRAEAPVGLGEGALSWEYSNDSVNAPTTPQGSTTSPKLELLTPGVRPSHRYAVRVYARNGIGSGAYSPVAYIVTEAPPPSPEPDPAIASFEQTPTTSISTGRETVDSREYTTVWKRGGRINGSQTDTWAAVPVVEREGVARVTPSMTWQKLSTKVTRNYYEIAGWPLTLTGSVTETVTYDRTPGREGQIAGREQEKVHQEWSPQGFLNKRTTWRSKGGWTAAEIYDGKVIRRVLNNQREVIQELWLPNGDGLWYYERSGVGVALVPVYTYIGQEVGDWETIESAPKAIPGERTVSEEAPPQAVLPQAARQDRQKEKASDPPPLVRNKTPGAVDRYVLDEPWFTTNSGGGDGPPGPPSDPPADPPKGPKEPEKLPNGNGDITGNPEPDVPKENKEKVTPRGTWSMTFTTPGETPGEVNPGADVPPGSGAEVSPGTGEVQTSIPWVRNALALQNYAAMIASAAGPRLRITRTYLLPTNPPSLDVATSISASGTSGNFSMTVTTETR